jgi:hypothetical protein
MSGSQCRETGKRGRWSCGRRYFAKRTHRCAGATGGHDSYHSRIVSGLDGNDHLDLINGDDHLDLAGVAFWGRHSRELNQPVLAKDWLPGSPCGVRAGKGTYTEQYRYQKAVAVSDGSTDGQSDSTTAFSA